MEVHHHPDLQHRRKKFKEYFLEFLMIFLAVTLGFFAESFREHLAETSKEREYMKEICENLKYDTIRCSLNAQRNVLLLKGMDSLRAELKAAVRGEVQTNKLYYFNLSYGAQLNEAVFNTSAITELKNSGSLRLIGNRKIVNLVSDYYERQITAAMSYDPQLQSIELQKKEGLFFSLIDLDSYVNSFGKIDTDNYKNDFNYQQILEKKPSLTLINSDPKSLEELYNSETKYVIALQTYNFWLIYCKNAATNLIGEIEKEYHLN